MSQHSNDNKRIAYNTILLYVRMFFLVLISLYTSRIVLKTLGIEDFGINNVVGGIISFLGFLTNSLSGASSRFLTFALGKGDFTKLKKIFNNIVSIHILFAIIILLIGETIGLWFVMYKLNIPVAREHAAFWVYQFSIITAMGSFISMPYNAAVIAHEKMSAFAYLTIGDAVLKLLAVFFLTVSPYDKLIMYAGMILCIQLFDFVVYIVYCNKHFKETCLTRLVIEKSLFKEIFYYAGWTMNGNLAIFGYTQGLNILLNIFFGPLVNAARGVAVQVQNIVNNFSTNFQMALNPQLTKNYAQENYVRMHELLIVSSKFSFFLLFFICLPLMLETEIVLSWWLGKYPEHSVSFLRLILITSLLYTLANPIITSIHATGNIKFFQIVEGSMLLCIVPISYFFLALFKIPPEIVFIIHICVELCTQYARLKIVLPKIRLDFRFYINKTIVPIVKVVLSAPIIPLVFFSILPQGKFTTFLIICSVCSLCMLFCIYFFGCDKQEKTFVRNKVKRVLYGKKN